MEQVFASLSKRQTMLLLTSMAVGGPDAVQAFAHLPADEEELLKYRAPMLLQMPKEQRIPLLVQELKRLVTQRRKQLGNADPEQLAAVLSKERPALIEVVLRSLPSELAEATWQFMGGGRRPELKREVRSDIQAIVRARLEEAIRARTPPLGLFKFSDVLTLQQREVLAICDRMGARVLATAIAGLDEGARVALLGQLPPDQRALATRAAEAGKQKRLAEEDARLVLDIHGGRENPSAGMRSAGSQRLVRAAVAQGLEFAQRFVERHHGTDFGKLLVRWLRDERNRATKGDGGRADIVEQIERLAQKGVIDRPIRLPPPQRPPPPRRSTQARPPPRPVDQEAVPTPPRQRPRPSTGLPGGKVMAPPVRERAPNASMGEGSQRRVLRDGKPLAREESPVVQGVPRRRGSSGESEPPANAPSRSRVIKGKR